jgi:hypothetical protein
VHIINNQDMKGVFFIWQWTWNLLNCHNLHIANRMGLQSCNWFNIFKKCQLNIEKKFTQNNLLLLELSNSLLLFFVTLLEILFVGNVVFQKLLLVGVVIAYWKRFFFSILSWKWCSLIVLIVDVWMLLLFLLLLLMLLLKL